MRFMLPLSALLTLTCMTAVQATEKAEVAIEGVRLTREIPCNGQDIGIYGADNTIRLSGSCGKVIVHGDGHTVTLETARSLTISGADHTVTSGALADLSVETSGHVVTATLSGDGAPAKVAVDGADQTLNLTLTGPTGIAVNGTGHQVNWSLAPGAPEPRIEMGGIDNAVNRVE